MKKTKNIAVIGCGTIAVTQHIPAYAANEDARILYFCDIVPEKARVCVEKYGCGEAIEDYHTALEDTRIDAVSICTPNHLHAVMTVEALRAGKHVLCEKPCAPTYAEALEMQKAQKESGRVLNIGVVNRFNTAVRRIKKMIDEGELGELYHIYLSFRAFRSIPGWGGWFTDKALSGGGVLIDWGVHFLDLAMYCAGDPKPFTASGKAFCKLGRSLSEYTYVNMWAGPPKPEGVYDVDDFFTGFVRTEGPTITLNGGWAQNIGDGEMYIDFLGSKAGIRLQYGGNYKLYGTKDGALISMESEYLTQDPYRDEIDAFLTCIDSGEKLPSHIDAVVVTAKLMQALYDSSENNREVVME